MGVTDNILELEKYKFIIEHDGNNFMVSFSNDKVEIYEKFIFQNLKNGYWNEYIGNNIVFIFKFEDGSISKYILNDSNYDEVLSLCCEFAQSNINFIEEMFTSNNFYKDKMLLNKLGGCDYE